MSPKESTEFHRRVTDYVERDRQWPRQHRINHARAMMARAKDDLTRNFWKAVIQRNED